MASTATGGSDERRASVAEGAGIRRDETWARVARSLSFPPVPCRAGLSRGAGTSSVAAGKLPEAESCTGETSGAPRVRRTVPAKPSSSFSGVSTSGAGRTGTASGGGSAPSSPSCLTSGARWTGTPRTPQEREAGSVKTTAGAAGSPVDCATPRRSGWKQSPSASIQAKAGWSPADSGLGAGPPSEPDGAGESAARRLTTAVVTPALVQTSSHSVGASAQAVRRRAPRQEVAAKRVSAGDCLFSALRPALLIGVQRSRFRNLPAPPRSVRRLLDEPRRETQWTQSASPQPAA